jgi:alginate O-acetyltransferase complex protein AlgJ
MRSNVVNFMKKTYPVIFALVFWGVSIAPILDPNLSINTIEKGFMGHDELIENYNNLRIAFGDHVFPNVIVGNNGWMFYTGERSIDDYQHTNAFTESELADLQKGFDSLFDQLLQKNITFIVVIAPDKNTIYPLHIPDQIKIVGSESRLDQFINYMLDYGKTPIIDLRPDLLEASRIEDVYYKTNTHWNPYGSFIAYEDIMAALFQRYPGPGSYPMSDYEAVHWGLITHDLTRILGTPNIQEDYWTLQPKFDIGIKFTEEPFSDGTNIRRSSNQDPNLPSALIYHDSFLVGVIPFLERHFSQTTSIPRTSTSGIWNLNWVDQVHPDIVIYEFVERFLNFNVLDLNQ